MTLHHHAAAVRAMNAPLVGPPPDPVWAAFERPSHDHAAAAAFLNGTEPPCARCITDSALLGYVQAYSDLSGRWMPQAKLRPKRDEHGVEDQQVQVLIDALEEAIAEGDSATIATLVDALSAPGPQSVCKGWPLSACGPMPSAAAPPAVFPVLDAFELEGFEECEHRTLEAAWQLLADNLDIVRWAMCRATGPGTGDCVIGHLLGTRRQVTLIRVDPDPDGVCRPPFPTGVLSGNRGFAMLSNFLTHNILVCGAWAPNQPLSSASQMYCSTDAAAQQCGLLVLAATLLHELLHICLRAGPPELPCTCKSTYLVMNYFLWAASHRYPEIWDSPCCNPPSPSPDRFHIPNPAVNDMGCLPKFGDPATCLPSANAPITLEPSDPVPVTGSLPDLEPIPGPFNDLHEPGTVSLTALKPIQTGQQGLYL